MVIKKLKPTSPGRRFRSYSTFEEITRATPEKNLLRVIKKSGGRNVYGRITCRHRGGGQKRHYRVIDFKRDKIEIPAKVAAIEYDPNRSARIALIYYADGEKRYILAPSELKVGDVMRKGRANPVVREQETVSSVLLKITRARAGCATIVDKSGRLKGIFTDGDLRRHLRAGENLARQKIATVMTKNPTAISQDRLAAEAMHILEAKKIDEIPVVDKNKKVVGLLDVQDLLEAGVV